MHPGAPGVEREVDPGDAGVGAIRRDAAAGLERRLLRAGLLVDVVVAPRHEHIRGMSVDGDSRLVLMVARREAGRAAH
jgi:hypothetical protein